MAVQGSWKEKSDIKIREPKKYKVIMYNDDFTPMDFVVEILMDIFHKEERQAITLMYQVHEEGHAVVGIYPKDIAITKVRLGTDRARQEGYPFKLAAEEE